MCLSQLIIISICVKNELSLKNLNHWVFVKCPVVRIIGQYIIFLKDGVRKKSKKSGSLRK